VGIKNGILFLNLTGIRGFRTNDKGTKSENSYFNVNYIASTVKMSTDSARNKEYFSSEFNRIKLNWWLFREKWIIYRFLDGTN